MWTPDQLRQRTLETNRGHEDQRSAQEAAQAEAWFQRSLKTFEREASSASSKGESEAISFEYEGVSETLDTLPPTARTVLERVRRHFESQGYKTRVKGPFAAGKMSSPSNGFDLYVQW